MPTLLLPPSRLERWMANVEARHGPTALAVDEGVLSGLADDGSRLRVALPFGARYDGPPLVGAVVAAAAPPPAWGVLLVRKGGFAVARLAGERMVEHKIGQRHVQGRTKAGGQSQQRFARRRDNQARQAYEAAADHAARVLGVGSREADGVSRVVVGGDRTAVDAVLADARLVRLEPVGPFLDAPDPRRAVLDRAVVDAGSLVVDIVNA